MAHGSLEITIPNGSISPYTSKSGNTYTIGIGETRDISLYTITANEKVGMSFSKWAFETNQGVMSYRIIDENSSPTYIGFEFLDAGVGEATLTGSYTEDPKYLSLAGLDLVVQKINQLINGKIGTIENEIQNINTGNGV